MTGLFLHPRSPAPTSALLSFLKHWPAEVLRRQRRLAIFAAVLLSLLLPMAIAWSLDDRLLRGVNVWDKPMKFSLSIAVLALTTAWFTGHLAPERRAGRAVRRIVWTVMLAGGLELFYITLQAALGQASHYNESDLAHQVLYGLMGMGALTLAATQPMLAWQLWRHPDPRRSAALRLAVVLGLVLTFALGATVGGLLSQMQPPSEPPRLPVFGWSLAGGDLRPAHFVGIHSGQILPLLGLCLARLAPRRAGALVWTSAALYLLLFGVLAAWGLQRF